MKSLPIDTIVKVAARAPWVFIGLIVEVALTMAVLLNVAAIVSDHMALIRTESGVPESGLAVIQSIQTDLGKNKGDFQGSLEALRETPGVQSAAMGDVPLWNVRKAPVGTTSDGSTSTVDAYSFTGSQGLGKVLALHYVAGRSISDLEIPDASALGPGTVFPVVLSQALSTRLFGESNALGRTVYFGSQSARVVGVVDHLRGAITGTSEDDYSFLTEYRLSSQDIGGGFVIRGDPAHLKQTLAAASKALHSANPNHVQQLVETMDDLRADYFRDRAATARLLLGVAAILVLITVGGIAGLGIYWVHQRRGEIGIRRALGADRGDIMLYFQLENLLVMTAGAVLGSLTALAMSLYLTEYYGVPHIRVVTMAMTFIALTVLGQTAVFWPAHRASRVSPASAINGA